MERVRSLCRCRRDSGYARIPSWEGGEGKITGQYLLNQLHRALQFIERGAFKQATDCLKAALRYPDNLGEGRLPGQTDNDIWYLLGYCAEQAGDAQQAAEYYQLARQGGSTLDAGRYYNDQPADYLFWQGIALRKSGNPAQAEQHFRHFIDWAAQHRDDVPQVDFCRLSSGPGGSRCISAAETSAALLVY